MQESRVIGVRFKGRLLTKIQQHDMGNCELIRTVMDRYFLDDGKNRDVNGFVNNGVNNVYSRGMVDILNDQIDDLKNDKVFLQDQNRALMIGSMPLLSRLKIKLLGND